MNPIIINDRKIGDGYPVFIIAELSANHNQDFEIAVKTIQAMKNAGADAVKLQTYTADTITIDSDNKYFQVNQGTIWDGNTLYGLYQQAYTPWDWQPKLKKIADDLGLICFSSPFDIGAVKFLEKIDVPAYKVASFEITDINLISFMASKGKPMIISTGIATQKDIDRAIEACHKVGNHQIILLKCTSGYPAKHSEMNLLTIPDMARKFKTVVGLSDHSSGLAAPISAVALGAKVIEKHVILDRAIGGPDSSFSLDPAELKLLVDEVRNAENALGKVTYELSDSSKNNRKFGRSLFVVENIAKGEVFTERNIRSIRPADGLPPRFLSEILGKKAKTAIKRGTPLSTKHF